MGRKKSGIDESESRGVEDKDSLFPRLGRCAQEGKASIPPGPEGPRSLAQAPMELRNDLKTPLCHSELVSESPKEGNNPDEILKQVQDDTLAWVLRSFLNRALERPFTAEPGD